MADEMGVALTEDGKPVVPAAANAPGPGAAVQYHFPVEIDVRGASAPVDPQEIVRLVCERLARRLEEEP